MTFSLPNPLKSSYKYWVRKNLEYIIFIILAIIIIYLMVRKQIDNFITADTGINKLDAIIYINLENRPDRKNTLLDELAKLNTLKHKIHKVSGVYIPKNGHKGCIQSHIIALNMIKLNNWKNVLILEDDIKMQFTPEIMNDVLDRAINILNGEDNYGAQESRHWDVLMLATENKILATHAHTPNTSQNVHNTTPLTTPITQEPAINLVLLDRATTASAYIVNNNYNYVDKLLDLFKECNKNMKPNTLSGNNYEYWALDQKWEKLQKRDNWYSIEPNLFKQSGIWSTTMNESHT